jgi:hypothetical protein
VSSPWQLLRFTQVHRQRSAKPLWASVRWRPLGDVGDKADMGSGGLQVQVEPGFGRRRFSRRLSGWTTGLDCRLGPCRRKGKTYFALFILGPKTERMVSATAGNCAAATPSRGPIPKPTIFIQNSVPSCPGVVPVIRLRISSRAIST